MDKENIKKILRESLTEQKKSENNTIFLPELEMNFKKLKKHLNDVYNLSLTKN